MTFIGLLRASMLKDNLTDEIGKYGISVVGPLPGVHTFATLILLKSNDECLAVAGGRQ